MALTTLALVTAGAGAATYTASEKARKQQKGQFAKQEADEAAAIKQAGDVKKSANIEAAMLKEREKKKRLTAGRRGTFSTSPSGLKTTQAAGGASGGGKKLLGE